MSTIMSPLHSPSRTDAAAAAQLLLPEARVYPAPRSKSDANAFGPRTLTNCTFVDLGTSHGFYQRPIRCASSGVASSTCTTQWDATETPVIRNASPQYRNAQPPLSRGPATGCPCSESSPFHSTKTSFPLSRTDNGPGRPSSERRKLYPDETLSKGTVRRSGFRFRSFLPRSVRL